MATLRKRHTKSGYVWVVDFSFEGRRYVMSTKTSEYAVAKQILHDIQGRIARGAFNLHDYEKKHIRLSDFFTEYFVYASSFKQPHTLVNERHYAKKFVSFVGDVNIRSVDIRLLDKWRVQILSEVAPTTFNIERRTLQAAFQLAVKWKYLDVNPFKEVDRALPDEKRLFMQDEELKKIYDLVDKDLRALRVKKHIVFLTRFRQLITFLLNTGLRRDEALALTVGNIDRAHNVIHIVQTKSKRMRTVPLNRIALAVLDQLTDDLFHRLNREHVSRKFAHYVQKAGYTGFKLHSLRHTFATNLVSAGVDIYTVSRLLGHSDIRTTLIYAKARMETLRDAVDKLETSKASGYKMVTRRSRRGAIR